MATQEGRVLMCLLDGSQHGEKVFETALKYRHANDKLHLVHGVEILQAEKWLPHLRHEKDPASEGFKQVGNKLMQHYLKEAKDKHVPNVTAHVIESPNPKESILSFAKSHKCSCIVVGSRGLGWAQRMLIGSFSRYILEHAPCEVVLVREEDKHAAEVAKERMEWVKKDEEAAAALSKDCQCGTLH
eukprot:g49942.t1